MSRATFSSFLIVVSPGLAALGTFSAVPGDEEELMAFLAAYARAWDPAGGGSTGVLPW